MGTVRSVHAAQEKLLLSQTVVAPWDRVGCPHFFADLFSKQRRPIASRPQAASLHHKRHQCFVQWKGYWELTGLPAPLVLVSVTVTATTLVDWVLNVKGTVRVNWVP